MVANDLGVNLDELQSTSPTSAAATSVKVPIKMRQADPAPTDTSSSSTSWLPYVVAVAGAVGLVAYGLAKKK